MGSFHTTGILTAFQISGKHTAIFLNNDKETSLFLNKKHPEYDILFKKLHKLQNKKVKITYGVQPGFFGVIEMFGCGVIMYDYVYNIKECNDNQYKGKIKHIIKLHNTDFYEIIFSKTTYDYIFIIDSTKYEQYNDSIKVGCKYVINFTHHKGDYYLIDDIQLESIIEN